MVHYAGTLLTKQIEQIVGKFLWKSTEQDIAGSLVRNERVFTNFSFVNPLLIIKHFVENSNPDEVLKVRVCKWFPSNTLNFNYSMIIMLRHTENGDYCVSLRDYFVLNADLNFEEHIYMTKSECMYLFHCISRVYLKKIIRIEYMEGEILYSSPIDHFSYVNPYVKKIAVLRIEDAWKRRSNRIRRTYMKKFRFVLEELSVIPPDGCYPGGWRYWKAFKDFRRLVNEQLGKTHNHP
jgi:hypothetical protein